MTFNLKNFLGIIIIPSLFLIISFLSLSHYGISWDEPIHFTRGQAYLHYFLTGDLNYQNLKIDRRSLYQDSSFTGQFFLRNDSGHPPINGILAALSNLIFYQKLGVLGDVESYHLFNILSATLLLVVVTLFAAQTYGLFVAIVAGLSLAVYPLFFAESHFNIKDPAEAAFYAGTIWAFWNSLKRYDLRWLLLAILFFALALGTKFNVLFLPFILILWLVWKNPQSFLHPFKMAGRMPRSFILILIGSPIIVGAIFFLTWPYLWQYPLANTLNIFEYYKEIGTGGLGQPKFLTPGGFNLFPIVWILITTPPLILFLTILGILGSTLRLDKEKTALLWLLWLIIPILRVSLPGSSIYGGIRQIMEFLPAMALLSGLGALALIQLLKRLTVKAFISEAVLGSVVLLLFIPHLLILMKLHPNENVYFNSFIGGLKGAQKANIPYYGNSFGNAYYPAVLWINKNASPGSRVGLIQGTSVNIPRSYFLSGIDYSNSAWSGINRQGEYLVELTHQGNEIAYPFAWEYVNRVLTPVYEVSVEGVTIAKVWKNDLEHSSPEYRDEKVLPIKSIQQIDDALEINLKDIFFLSKLRIEFNNKGNCQPFAAGFVQTSIDEVNWRTEVEKIPEYQVRVYPTLENGLIRYIFPANPASSLKIHTGSKNSCLFYGYKVEVWGFKGSGQ